MWYIEKFLYVTVNKIIAQAIRSGAESRILLTYNYKKLITIFHYYVRGLSGNKNSLQTYLFFYNSTVVHKTIHEISKKKLQEYIDNQTTT